MDGTLVLYGLAGSRLVSVAREIGLAAANEVFADRSYQDDGSLTPRGKPGAMIEDVDLAVAQVVRMVREGKVRSVDGRTWRCRPIRSASMATSPTRWCSPAASGRRWKTPASKCACRAPELPAIGTCRGQVRQAQGRRGAGSGPPQPRRLFLGILFRGTAVGLQDPGSTSCT